MVKVLIVSKKPMPKLEEELKKLEGVGDKLNLVVIPKDENAVKEHIKDAVIFMPAPDKYPVDAALLDLAPQLKLIHTGTGYDYVDLNAATERGIAVASTPGVAAPAVAEHTFYLINRVTSEISGKYSIENKNWNKGSSRIELTGRTIGLIGFGNIGKAVYRIAHQGYGMNVLVHRKKQTSEGCNIKLVGLAELYEKADIISIHVPLTEKTHNLIGKTAFDAMQNSAFLINTARGAVVDEQALIEALEQGKIAGAGLDAYSTEPLPPDHPLRKAPNVILTPHVAGRSDKTSERRAKFYANNIKRLLDGENLVAVVNSIRNRG